MKISVNVNGRNVDADVEPRKLLVDFIRDDLHLTGTHVGCDTSGCGACTVLLDGVAVKSCTMFAVQANNRNITTIEGLSKGDELHRLQSAFIEEGGLQCGYCTPGMIMTSAWLLSNNAAPTEEEIRNGISGNLCRCTGYDSIIRSIQKASSDRRGGRK